MRRLLGLWMLATALVLSLIPGSAGVLAQESTPDGPVINVPNPVPGDTISFVSESGSEIARLRATEVILNWDEYSEYYVPHAGSQYVAIMVDVTNFGSRGSLIVRADDFRLQDVDGFFYSRSWADAAEGSDLIPSESEIGVASGETEELVLIYEVLTGVELGHLFWQPEYERLLTVADMDAFIPGQE
ncbi:MAG: hypothetical protein H0T93_09025 [Chloroflexia bacterium]|nr:hypothetical protein [Chloroflexia bacterium]